MVPPTCVGAPEAKRRYKVSVLGLGAMGRRHARVLGALRDRFEVVGGYDVDPAVEWPAALRRLACEAEAIARAEVVVVATPSALHAETGARILACGRHLLVEKPLATTADQASALATAASRGAARLFVGHSERFNPVVRVLTRIARDECVVALDLRRIGHGRGKGIGALFELGVHDFDLAAYLGGGPLTLRAAVGGCEGGAGEDLAHVLFVTARGAPGHLHVERASPVRERWLRMLTPRWLYEGDLLEHRLWRAARPAGSRTEVPLPIEEPLAAQALALADALDASADRDAALPREIAGASDGAMAVALAEQAAVACSEVAGALSGVQDAPGQRTS